MSMRKQPEGVRRVAKVPGEKPPQSYELYLGKGKSEVYLGWSERLDKGQWKAHPVKEGGEVPPFRNHTALVEFMLAALKGAEVHPGTQETSTAEETAAILADPDTMAAIKEAQAETDEQAQDLADAIAADPYSHGKPLDEDEDVLTTLTDEEWDSLSDEQKQLRKELMERVLAKTDAALVSDDDVPEYQHPDEDPDTVEPLLEWERSVLAQHGESGAASFPPEGQAPEAKLADPDGVPFSHADPDQPWEHPKGETGVTVPRVASEPDDFWGTVDKAHGGTAPDDMS